MKVFGYPEYDQNGMCVLTETVGDYAGMLMNITCYRMKQGESRTFFMENEEIAVLLMDGDINISWNGGEKRAVRENLFENDLSCLHVSCGTTVTVKAEKESNILVQSTENKNKFEPKFYEIGDCMVNMSGVELCGNTAVRRVITVFDHDSAPYSNMVIGEVFSNQGNWSAYPPHHHPQPEVYYYRFDKPQGFGAAFVGDDVYKIKDGSFSAIPGGLTHPQSSAPGYKMYTCWMIRHFDGDPWTDRIDDPDHTWLYDAKF